MRNSDLLAVTAGAWVGHLITNGNDSYYFAIGVTWVLLFSIFCNLLGLSEGSK